MALAYWLTHEETRVEEVKKVMTKEEKGPLYIKAELVSPKAAINNHNLISFDVVLAPKYIATKEKSIIHLEYTVRMLGTEIPQACQRRWNALPHSL